MKNFSGRHFGKKNGVILLTTILLIAFATISVYGVTTFVVERLVSSETQTVNNQAIYLAQAGIHSALYDFRNNDLSGNGYFSLGQTDIDSNNYFVIGGSQADLLMVNTSFTVLGGEYTPRECRAMARTCRRECRDDRNDCYEDCDDAQDECYDDAYAVYEACRAACPGGWQGWLCRILCQLDLYDAYGACDDAWGNCRDQCYADYLTCVTECDDDLQDCIDGNKLTDIYIQNVTDSQTITIDRMIVTWDNAHQLEEIVIDAQTVWTGSASSSADANLNPDFTLNASQTIYSIDHLEFSGTMADATTASIEFVMADGSSKSVLVYPESDNNNFTVRSTGKTAQSSVYRTMAATYNSLTGEVMALEEDNSEVSP